MKGLNYVPDNNHEKRRKDLRQPKQDIRHDGPELGEAPGRQQVADDLLEVVEDDAAVLHGRDDGLERVEQHHVGGLDRDVRGGPAPAHRDPDVGRLQRRRVVDSVARHGHCKHPSGVSNCFFISKYLSEVWAGRFFFLFFQLACSRLCMPPFSTVGNFKH